MATTIPFQCEDTWFSNLGWAMSASRTGNARLFFFDNWPAIAFAKKYLVSSMVVARLEYKTLATVTQVFVRGNNSRALSDWRSPTFTMIPSPTYKHEFMYYEYVFLQVISAAICASLVRFMYHCSVYVTATSQPNIERIHHQDLLVSEFHHTFCRQIFMVCCQQDKSLTGPMFSGVNM